MTNRIRAIMDCKVTLGTDDKAYLDAVASLVRVYNQVAKYKANPKIKYPENTAVISLKGMDGGLFLDRHDEGFWRVMLAAFPEQHQRKGYLGICLTAAELHGLDIQAVEVDLEDTDDIWKKRGFTEKGLVNLTPILFKPGMKEKYKINSTNSGDGLPLDQVLRMLAQYRQD